MQVDREYGKAYAILRLWPFAVDEAAHREAGLRVEGFKSASDGGAGFGSLVLAYLPFCFEASDGKFDTNDAFCDAFDVAGRRIAHFPWSRR